MSDSASGHRKYVSVKTIGKRMERILIQYETNPPPAYDEESGASSEAATNNEEILYSTVTGLDNMPHIVEYGAKSLRNTDNNRNNRRKYDRYKPRTNGREHHLREREEQSRETEQRSTEREQLSNVKEERPNDNQSSDQNGTKKKKNQTNGIRAAQNVRDSDTENDAPLGKTNMKNRKRRSSIRSN